MTELYRLADLAGVPQAFALVAFRLMGLMVVAPMLGSGRIPRMVKMYLAVSMALCLASAGNLPVPEVMPDSPWLMALGLLGEIAFGLVAGMLLSVAFYAARWAGGVAGQQMGFNMAGALNPGADIGGNPLGDALFVLTLFVFLSLDGHLEMIMGIRQSFDHVPPLAFAVSPDTLDLLTGALASSVALALRIAAPVCVSMLVVDLSLGMLGKTIPALNLLSVGLSLRAGIGMCVVLAGMSLTGGLLADAIAEGVTLAEALWTQTPRT